MTWHSNAKPPRAVGDMRAVVEDAIKRLEGYPDSKLDGADALAAIAECDRLRRELEQLRAWVEDDLAWREDAGDVYGTAPLRQMRRRLDAILRGES